MSKEEDINKLIEKATKTAKDNKLDLSADEDLSIGIMNLISIEEHLFFTAQKTGKDEYYLLLKETREMRKGLLKEIVKDYEGEVWCISKHLLAASMRLMEVGTKELGKGNDQKAKELFSKAYDLYTMFWGINLKMLDGKGVDKKQVIKESVKENYLTAAVAPDEEKKPAFLSKMREALTKAIDCCKE
ncbi:Uncharacterised protein [uncultured archaeon]|nr:Uncharacterised protein [uncultured archaeon]